MKTEEQTNIRHVSASIEGMLRLRKRLNGLLYDDDGRPMGDKEARAKLRELQSKGDKYIASTDCNNFCPQNGCLGHTKTNTII